MDNLESEPVAKSGFSFEPSITLGNILSGSLMLASVLLWGARLEGRMNSETMLRDEQHISYEKRLDGIQDQARLQIQQIEHDTDNADKDRRSEMRDIKDTLGRIELKLDTKADKK